MVQSLDGLREGGDLSRESAEPLRARRGEPERERGEAERSLPFPLVFLSGLPLASLLSPLSLPLVSIGEPERLFLSFFAFLGEGDLDSEPAARFFGGGEASELGERLRSLDGDSESDLLLLFCDFFFSLGEGERESSEERLLLEDRRLLRERLGERLRERLRSRERLRERRPPPPRLLYASLPRGRPFARCTMIRIELLGMHRPSRSWMASSASLVSSNSTNAKPYLIAMLRMRP